MATGKAINFCRQCGFTYIGLLLFIAIASIALAAIGPVWHTEAQREREKELLFAGEQYAQAIGSYYESTPGGVKQYPASLQYLLHDHRFTGIKRHLRMLYRDPMTGGNEWGLIKEQGRITGVYSLSGQRPLKASGFPVAWAAFASAEKYAAWQFIYAPGTFLITQQSSPDAGGTPGAIPGANGVTISHGVYPASGQPGNPALNGGQTGGATPDLNLPNSGTDFTRQQICLGQRVSDNAACSFYCMAKGLGTECSQCQASMLSRYNACLKGDSLPALADGG